MSTATNAPNTANAGLRRAAGAILGLIIALVVVLGLITVVLLLLGKDPLAAGSEFIQGAIGSDSGRADVVMAALPLLLSASGLLITFTAGLWNIGVEGQITIGAIGATLIARTITKDMSSPLIIPAELICAILGGMLWAAVAALLKTKGHVNEIFGGVALNFIAQNILIALINGPWKGGGRTAQTDPFAPAALLPRIAGVRLSPMAIVIAAIAFLIVFFVLRGTRWGLQLKAMGRSARSAFLLGVRTDRHVLLSMMACGAFAGLAGAFQVLTIQSKLVTNISGGVGFLGVLIVLLVNIQPLWVPLVALFFAFVPVGSLSLASALDDAVRLDSSLGNVFQSGLVLAVLFVNGIRTRGRSKSS